MNACKQKLRNLPAERCVRRDFAAPFASARRAEYIFLFAIVFACAVAVADSGVLSAQTKCSGEYQVKAEYLYNFAKFTVWPANTFVDLRQPIGVCILGRDPFGHHLEAALLGKLIGERPLMLGRAAQIQDLSGCQIVFIAGSENWRLPNLVNHLQGRPVLLVGETEGFAESGGAIQFTVERAQVHFVINPDAAARSGLKISSKLLALARIVRDPNQSVDGSDLK